MEELKCPCCKNQYTDENPPRLLTMCGHTYCQLCIKSMIKHKEHCFQIRCPEDKLKLLLDHSTTSQFPRNMVLIEAMNKNKPKIFTPEDKNQFLGGLSEEIGSPNSRRLFGNLDSSTFIFKRASLEEGMCLLHQKHLDIICLQQKISICAQCALFGLHKGHQFTTLRDLQIKRNKWIHSVSQILEQQKIIQSKTIQSSIQKEISNLVFKKKEALSNQITEFYGKIQTALRKSEQSLRKELNSQIGKIEQNLIGKCKVKWQTKESFKEWQLKILQKIDHLQSLDIIKSIDVFTGILITNEDNLISKGHSLIQQLNHQLSTFWKNTETTLLYPTLSFSKSVEQAIAEMAKVHLCSIPSHNKRFAMTEPDQKCQATTVYEPSHFENDQISLLQFRGNFKDELTSTTFSNYFQEPLNQIEKPNFVRLSEMNDSSKVNKSKTKLLVFNKSLINIHDNRNSYNSFNSFNSPNTKKHTHVLSKGNILSPTPTKDKMKMCLFKVKDPQRFDKLLRATQNSYPQNLDFTGLEMGNNVAKEVFSRIKQCKTRAVRLMKNQLTDECLPALMQCLPFIEVLNLAQNSFSSKILQILCTFAKDHPSEKVRNIQLGQNNINSRKCRQKIQQLKGYGIVISL